MAEYIVVRIATNKRKPYAPTKPFVEIVSAPSKRALRGYYLDWDSDTPDIIYTTLVMKRYKGGD